MVSIIRNSDTIQIVRGTEVVDDYGSRRMDWSNPTVVAEGKASVQYFMTTEDNVERQTTIEGLRVISNDPNLFDFLPTDRVVYAGEVYEVDAEVQQWRFFGKVHHIEVYIRKVTG